MYCYSQPSHNKHKVNIDIIVLHIMPLKYPFVGVFVHSFYSLNATSVTCNSVLPLLDEKGCTRQIL